MKSEIWPDVGMPEMTDWLAELRDGGDTEPTDGDAEQPGDSHAAPTAVDDPIPEDLVPVQVSDPILADQTGGPAKPWPTGWAWTRPGTSTPAEISTSGETGPPRWLEAPVGKHAARQASATAETTKPAESAEVTEPAVPVETVGRSLIGDELRRPITWCEMDSCISWHADPAALGEADIRARAISAGWRVDAFGRLACPQCQQTDPGFRVAHPVVLWNRRAAITGASRMAVTRSNSAAWGHGRDSRRPASGHAATGAPTPGRHRGRPTAESMPASRPA
jgi:hypothetical protein